MTAKKNKQKKLLEGGKIKTDHGKVHVHFLKSLKGRNSDRQIYRKTDSPTDRPKKKKAFRPVYKISKTLVTKSFGELTGLYQTQKMNTQTGPVDKLSTS